MNIELAELFCRAQVDDLDGALDRLNELLGASDSWLAPQLSVLRARLELAVGNLSGATDAATACLRWSAEIADSSSEPAARQILALVALLKGQLSEAREQAGTDDQIRALLAMADGDASAAARLLDAPLDYPERHDLLILAATTTPDPLTATQAEHLLTQQAAATPTTTFQAAAELVAAHNQLRKATARTEEDTGAAGGSSPSAAGAGLGAVGAGADAVWVGVRERFVAVIGLLEGSPRLLLVARGLECWGRLSWRVGIGRLGWLRWSGRLRGLGGWGRRRRLRKYRRCFRLRGCGGGGGLRCSSDLSLGGRR